MCIDICRAGRDSKNPFTIEPWATYEYRPWLHYNAVTHMPEGDVCIACWTAFLIGQFKVQHSAIKKLRKEIDASMQLAKEFKECSLQVVLMVNNGELELKVRATDQQKSVLVNVRARVVEEFKTTEQLVDSVFKHMTPARYLEKEGRTYEEDGLTLEWVWANRP